MRLSSIFNSDSYHIKWHFSSWMLMFLALIILAELVLRIPAVTAILPKPEPTLWHSDQIQAKLDILKQFEADRDIDVLFVGNSTTQAGISPRIFDAARGNNVQTLPGAFNASIEGLPPFGVAMFLKIYLQYTRPNMIIYGIAPQDLNANSPWAADVTDRVKHSPMALAESKTGLKGHVISFLLQYSRIYRYRFVLLQLLLRGGMFPAPSEAYFDAQGFGGLENRLSEVPAAERGKYFNNAGVLNYSTRGEQSDALQNIITFAKNRNITLILVNMPLANDYYRNFSSADDYQAYLAAINKLASDNNLPLWDMETLSNADIFDDAKFSDFNHLNISGAEMLSTLLADQYLELKEGTGSAKQQ